MFNKFIEEYDKNKKKWETKKSGKKYVVGNTTKYEFISNGKYNIEITNNLISLENKGAQNFLNKGAVGSKTIKIENISAVQLKEAGALTGYIQFVIVGSQESKGGVLNAVKDENTITFTTKIEEAYAKEIKKYIESYTPVDKTSSISVADEILKFKNLLDEGIITEEEFNLKKKALLNI